MFLTAYRSGIACIYIRPRRGATVLRLWPREGRGEFYMTHCQVALSRPRDAFTKPPGCICIPGVGKYFSLHFELCVTLRLSGHWIPLLRHACKKPLVEGGGGGKWCFGTLCTFFGFGFFYFPSVVVLSFSFLWEHYRAVAL